MTAARLITLESSLRAGVREEEMPTFAEVGPQLLTERRTARLRYGPASAADLASKGGVGDRLSSRRRRRPEGGSLCSFRSFRAGAPDRTTCTRSPPSGSRSTLPASSDGSAAP